jgi:hypothetical protein
MLAMLAEKGDAGGEMALPPAIQALLAARLDCLAPGERQVLERASVEGDVFHVGGLVALGAAESRAAAEAALSGLVHKELVHAERARLAGEEAFRFRHGLIREAAYDRLAKEARSDLHERFAAWLLGAAGTRASEFEEVVAYHLEQAQRYGAEIDPTSARASALADEARRRLASAGRLAFHRGDVPAAANLLERARALPSTDDRAWLSLAPDVGFGLFQAGALGRADRLLTEAIDHAGGREPRIEGQAWVVRALVRLYTQPDRIDIAETRTRTEERIAALRDGGDELGLTRAWSLLWHVACTSNDAASLRHSAESALRHARSVGSRLDEAWALSLLGWSLVDGPAPVAECLEACEAMRPALRIDPLGDVTLSAFVAALAAMSGRLEEARALIVRSRQGLREHGTGTLRSIIEVEVMSSRVESLAGDFAAAEAASRAGAGHSAEMGDNWFHVIALIELARALCDQGRLDECLRVLDESERLSSPPDGEIVIKRPAVRALALARRGRLAEAEILSAAAVAHAEGTEFLGFHAEALLVRAEVRRLVGDGEAASAARSAALALLDRKGDVVSAARVRSSQG